MLLRIVIVLLVLASPGGATRAFAGQSVGSGGEPSGDRLLISSRDRLAVCVQPSAGLTLDRQAALTPVLAALGLVTQHPDWTADQIGRIAPTAEYGCPSDGVLLQTGAQIEGGKITAYPPGAVVERGSTYYLFILVLPRERVASLFPSPGTGGAPLAAQEVSCVAGACRDVTFGLYLAPDQLADPQTVAGWIGQSLGMQPQPHTSTIASAPGARSTANAAGAGAPTNRAGGNVGTNLVTPAASALSMTVSTLVNPVTIGLQTRFDWRIQNFGATPATGTTFTSTLPVGLNFFSAFVSDASFNILDTCTYTAATRVVSCPVGTVGTSGQSSMRIVQVNMKLGLRGNISASATVTSSADVQPGGITATQQITVNPIACAPRSAASNPKVDVKVERINGSSVNVTVTANTTGVTHNGLEQITFTQTNGALIDFPGGPAGQSGAFSRVIGGESLSTSFVVSRSGAAGATARFNVVDYCVEPWRSLAGIGAPTANLIAPAGLLFGLEPDNQYLGGTDN